MFGYVKVDSDDLRVRELKEYKQFYCGLCRQIANYSQVARLMLSYDMVFLLLLYDAPLPAETRPCKRKILRQCRRICGDAKLDYIAAVSVMLLYFKLQNDVFDGDRVKQGLMTAIKSGYEKAAAHFPEIHRSIDSCMARLYDLEKEKSQNDRALEDAFASIFSEIFKYAPDEDEFTPIRGQIAYHIGAWVYWFDMLIDEKKDEQNDAFNAILISSSPDGSRKKLVECCLEHLEKADELVSVLPYGDNVSIIENVISRGLAEQMRDAGLV